VTRRKDVLFPPIRSFVGVVIPFGVPMKRMLNAEESTFSSVHKSAESVSSARRDKKYLLYMVSTKKFACCPSLEVAIEELRTDTEALKPS
jgi:hypothetical protein